MPCHVNAHIAHICTVIRMFLLRFLIRENEEEKRQRNDVSLRSSNVRQEPGLEKTRVFLKKPSPVGFFGFFWFFLGFLGFFGFFGVFLPRREGF
jgi:hypothetical protein